MAAIRHTLQREIFTPNDEKILNICSVRKAYKKKKTSFLCLTAVTDTPDSYFLHQVKKSDKNVFKKKQSWSLADIRTVDGVDENSMDLELHIDKIYKWSVITAQEKQSFVINLYTCSFSLPQRAEFKNLPKEWLLDSSYIKEGSLDKSIKLNAGIPYFKNTFNIFFILFIMTIPLLFLNK